MHRIRSAATLLLHLGTCLLACLSIPQFARAADPVHPAPAANNHPAVPHFVEQYCTECHDDTTQKGGLRLDNLPADFSNPEFAATWTDVFDKLSAGEMPPKKKPRPPEPEMQGVLNWLRSGLTAADLARRSANGRVVLRRLNRVEYQNTIHDLLGVDTDVKDVLPEDATALGFDNVASALNVSSVLMERYLEAADLALDDAIQTGARPETKKWDVSAGPNTTNPDDYRLKGGVKALPDGGFVHFNSSGQTPILCDHFRAPSEGRYRFRVYAYAYQSPNKPLTMCILAGAFDSKNPQKTTVGFFDVPPEAAHPRIVEFTQDLPKSGTLKIMAFGTGKKGVRDTTRYDGPGVCVQHIEVEGPLNEVWPPASHRRLFGDLNLETATGADAERVLTAFAARAFRRPITRDDVEPYVALVRERLAALQAAQPPVDPKKPRKRSVDEKTPFEEAIRIGLKGILCSPEFLFFREPAGRLDDYAVASRLSYFLWSTMPDDELLQRAADHTLTRPDVLRAQTERLLKDPRARAFTENFTGQWLGLRQIDLTAPDMKLYPEFDAQLEWSMVGETQHFFDEILGKDLSLVNFIDSSFTFLNERLARHYGIEGVEGNALRRVALPPGTHRGGVLGQGAVLKVTANGTTTSPVVRGAWVMRNLLGRPPKPPPPNVPAVEPDIRGATTIREQLDKHRSVPMCASCHRNIDPPGNALESFDAIGGWRENYRTVGAATGVVPKVSVFEYRVGYKLGPKVDPSDTLVDGRKFDGFDQFKQLLLNDKDQVAHCLTEKLVVYATGAGLGFADRPAIDELVRRSRERGYGFRSLVHDVVESPLFLNK